MTCGGPAASRSRVRTDALVRRVTGDRLTWNAVSELGTFVGGTGGSDPATGRPTCSLDILDLDHDHLTRIAVDFLPHGFTRKPNAPHIAAIFEKRGPGAALVDLITKQRLGTLTARAGRHYYGHGVYSRDGDQLFVVETELATGKGLLSVRDTAHYREVDSFPTYGERPHDCVPIDDGRVLVITNGGGDLGTPSAPCVSYVDVASRRLLEKVCFSDPKINAGHIGVGADGSLAVVSAPRDGLPAETSPGGINLRAGKRKPERMRGPDKVMAKVIGESLSVVVHDGIVGVTNPFGGIVTFWSLATKKLVAYYECESPRGIEVSRDKTAFVVAFGKHASVVLLDVKTYRPLDRTFGSARLAGSHIFPLI